MPRSKLRGIFLFALTCHSKVIRFPVKRSFFLPSEKHTYFIAIARVEKISPRSA